MLTASSAHPQQSIDDKASSRARAPCGNRPPPAPGPPGAPEAEAAPVATPRGCARRQVERVHGRRWLPGVLPTDAAVPQETAVPESRPEGPIQLEVGRPKAHHAPATKGIAGRVSIHQPPAQAMHRATLPRPAARLGCPRHAQRGRQPGWPAGTDSGSRCRDAALLHQPVLLPQQLLPPSRVAHAVASASGVRITEGRPGCGSQKGTSPLSS